MRRNSEEPMPLARISEPEAATAQFMACKISHALGYRVAAKSIGVSKDLLWKWAHAKHTPTPAKFRMLQSAYEEMKYVQSQNK
jgi:hypothetical protein